jgi:hypothetical protein
MKPIMDVNMPVARLIKNPDKTLMAAPMTATIAVSATATRQPISF